MEMLLSTSDMIYTSSLEHLAIEGHLHLVGGKLVPLWAM